VKKLFGLFLAGVFVLGGCATAGKLSNAVGEKFHEFSDKQDSGIIKDSTKLVGDVHVTAGNAVAPKKAEPAKAPAAVKKVKAADPKVTAPKEPSKASM
jgi:hypothetical protein